MKKEIITICGSLGSGKSSTAKKVAGALGYRHFSSGDFFRQVGLELGLSVTETNLRAETDPTIDELTDQKLRDMNKEDKVVIDSRTAYHWIPESFKVYLDLPVNIAHQRILNSLKENVFRQKSEKDASTPKEVLMKMEERFESEQKRYQKLYKINNKDRNNFDLVVDTNENNLEQVVEIVLSKYKEWLNS